jgi:hypothetical protein
MKKLLSLTALASILAFSPAVYADDFKPDDRIVFDVSAEEWVTTQTARVTVGVNAAVAGASAGTMRADMVQAVNALAKADWRLINFSRNQDQTGLERWYAVYEARLPETSLGGLHEAAKKSSKAGMQLAISEIDFSPTLAEIEAVRATLRSQLAKQVNDQLAAMNTALPGRSYRIAEVNFMSQGGGMMQPQMMMRADKMYASDAAVASSSAPMERSQKITMSVQAVLAALAPVPKEEKQ